ncbi:MAG: hypothetical protein HQL13_08425, partial [Candidatus Omnitrophica bacterium]|nr:hypothetical protein [Candidatus Omnitrophota bacterium]
MLQESGTTIEIHALVLEDGREVKVEIYSQESGYTEPHFSAIFEVNIPSIYEAIKGKEANRFPPLCEAIKEGDRGSSLSKRTAKVIDLDMQTDIYGPILFQGKMFQGIEKIHELNYDEKTKKGQALLTGVFNSEKSFLIK